MSSTPSPGGMMFVEPLESRIAPTNIAFAGDPGDSSAVNNPNYITYTKPAANGLAFVPASVYLGTSAPANLYAIKLSGNGGIDASNVSTGDELVVFNNVSGFNPALPLIQADKGTVVAFFLDDPTRYGDATRLKGQVYADELVGVSVGKKTSFSVNGNVHGDIVTNLLGASGSFSLTSDGNHKQNISGLTMSGNVFGNILAGGDITNVNIVGTVNNVLAGTATNGVAYNFTGDAAMTSGTISNAAGAGHHGSNITNFTVSAVTPNGRIQAGDGAFAAIGGAITDLRIESDTAGFNIFSGAGGDGGSGVAGGAGGAISSVVIQGTAGTSPNALILIQAGHGGNNGAGHGGLGGAISGLAVGFSDSFDFAANSGAVSADFLGQNVIVRGGQGGSGIKGGGGGIVEFTQVVGSIGDDGVIGGDGVGNAEIQIFGGTGGTALAADHGKGGKGGNLSQVTAENLDLDTTGQNSSILLQGGAGGAAKGGGSVEGVDLLGTILTVNGGLGGNGINKGGLGGSLNEVGILDLNGLLAHQVTLNGGTGGDSSNGFGGAGGSVNGVTMTDADLTVMAINSGTHANGGRGGNGIGGAGGAVTNVSLLNSAPSGNLATISVRTGQGGDGTTGGGAGGAVDTFQALGSSFSFSIAASAGGSASVAGSGGMGGSLATVGITNAVIDTSPFGDPTPLSGAVSAGAGGNGIGSGGLGGKGGDLTAVNVRAVYNVGMTAGSAGNGPGGAAVGGSITGAAAISIQGGVTAMSGSGGQTSGGASNAGSITGLIAAGQTSLSMLAGNGGSGGAGGSIINSGTTTDELTAQPNLGNLTVTAGNGSSANGSGGAGGDITNFTGYVADGGLTALTAGTGGGGVNATQSGRGGSIDTVKLTGTSGASETINGITAQTVTLDGGNAGVASASAKGRAGGSVSNVTIYDLDTNTLVQHIAAGDGAAAGRKGGAGGNVSQIHAGIPGEETVDIGVRSGLSYGYAAGGAGGIFAGVGGTGAKHTGLNGEVDSVTASAISSIVAGKSTPRMCSNISAIDLAGDTRSATDANGAFTNFNIANIVGSVQNPFTAGASTFKPGDGLIATSNPANLSTNNFPAEALLTIDAAGNLVLVDYQQPNLTPTQTPAPAFLA